VKKRLAIFFMGTVLLTVVTVLSFANAQAEQSQPASTFPVPRDQSVVFETDQTYQYFNTANPLKAYGTQWGNGWAQVVEEWDWYMNYATGEKILWRTTGWEYSKDNMSLTWHVRKGVTWNDGVPYTSADIAYTFKLWMDNPDLNGAGNASNIKSIETPDDYTVIFHFKTPDYRFHQKLRMWGGANIVAKHVYEGQDPHSFANWPPVETGPYKLQGYYNDLGLFIWERDPNYWGTKVMGKTPGPKYVIFRSAPPPDLDLKEFVAGNVDEPLPHIFTWDMIQAAQKQWNHTVLAPYMDAVSQGIVAFNTVVAPTSDRNFRWAVQYLLDRPKFVKIYPMAASTAETMWPWPAWANLKKWEVPAIKQKYGPMLRYDPAEAAKELDAAGYKMGSNGKRTLPDGKPFTLTLWSGASPDVSYQQASDFSNELTKIGIDNVLKVNGAGITPEQINKGEYSIGFDVLDIGAAFPDDPYRLFDSFSSKYAKPIGTTQLEGDRGKSRLQDPQLDAIAQKMAVTSPSDPNYINLVQQGLDRWYYDLPAVPATEKTFVQIFSNKYWTNWPQTGNMYQVPYQWWPSEIFILFELKPAAQ
jgi:peptide/nickel transport system substrate-binding protein